MPSMLRDKIKYGRGVEREHKLMGFLRLKVESYQLRMDEDSTTIGDWKRYFPLHSNDMTHEQLPLFLIPYLDSLCFFIYLDAQLPQGRCPSHLVLRARHLSQLAQSAIAPSFFSSLSSPMITYELGNDASMDGCSKGYQYESYVGQ